MSATEWIVISEIDLENERLSGGWIRAYCHIHRGDNQRSLSINEQSGFGRCHQCGAQVLVREINPEAATHIERGNFRICEGTIRVQDPKYIARAARAEPKPRTIQPWQKEEIALLRSLQDSMVSRLSDERAHAYMAGRGLSLETALALGVGYIPDMSFTGKYARLAPWADHIIFPVQSPAFGLQYVGRCLRLWEPGMNENDHHAILKSNKMDKYHKTHANGWFNFQVLEQSDHVIFVEGAFDALALLDAHIENAIAIIGTALDVDWLPKGLKQVTLAFDGDESGIEKSTKARETIYEHGFAVTLCYAPQDDLGKDWSERYRLHGREGLAPLLQPATIEVQENSSSQPETQVQEDATRALAPDCCSDCGIDLSMVDTGAYSDDGKPYCDHDPETREAYCSRKTKQKMTYDQFVNAAQLAASRLAESTGEQWTVTPISQDYTLKQHVAYLEQKARDEQKVLQLSAYRRRRSVKAS